MSTPYRLPFCHFFRPACGIAPATASRLPRAIAAGVLTLLAGTFAFAADANWPRFRGPDGSGVAEGALPESLDPSDANWSVQLNSVDAGSPAIWENRVYLMSAQSETAERHIVCLDLHSGNELWRHKFESQTHRLHARNTYASSTPCCDAERVYVSWSDPTQTVLSAFTHEGEPVWSRDLGSWQGQHGGGTSPVRAGEFLIYFDSQQKDQVRQGDEPGSSRVLALDPATGKTKWETPRTTTRVCYGVPLAVENEDGEEILVGANTGDGVFALDLQTGKPVWNAKVFGMRCVSTPQKHGNLYIGSAGSGGGGNHLVAVRAPQDGSPAEEVYRIERHAPYVPTPVIKDGLMYLVADKGVISCVDADSGQPAWSRRAGGNFYASPIIIGDQLLCINLEGTAFVYRTGSDYQPTGRFEFEAQVEATPAYANGHLLIRAGDRLYCFRSGKST